MILKNNPMGQGSKRPCGYLLALTLVTHVGAIVPVASAETRQYLEAPRVRSQLNVEWETKKKVLLWEIPGSQRDTGKIEADSMFVASRAVIVAYPRLNPLKVRASASAKAVADPAHATIVDLIKAIIAVTTTIAPSLTDTATNTKVRSAKVGQVIPSGEPKPLGCEEADSAQRNMLALHGFLYGSDSASDFLGTKVKGWIEELDNNLLSNMNGAAAVQKAVIAIQNDAASLSKVVKAAQAFSNAITACANDSSLTDATRAEYISASLTKASADDRLEQLSDVVAVMNKLAKTLQAEYQIPGRWLGSTRTDFQINDPTDPILATSANMQKVTVKVYSISLSVNERTGVLSVDQEDAGSAEFTIRRYSLFLPEPGVGAVFSKLKTPKYATAKNEKGETVIARVDDTPVSVNPTILVNFLCRCGIVHFAPMFQIGAQTSKDTPALLFGGGVRLFSMGKGDVAIGGGLLVAWVKDLQKLNIGSVVTGTNDIESDLGFSGSPRTRAYFAIQVKF